VAQVVIRDVDERDLERLRTRARDNGRSLESELRLMIKDQARQTAPDWREALEEVQRRFAGRRFSDSADLIREDRDNDEPYR
jgi:plasmid stability protein